MAFLILLCTNFTFAEEFSKYSEFDIEVVVKDIRNEKGKVLLSVYDQAEGFPGKSEYAIETHSADIKEGKAIFQFSLPAGEYALSVLHDENGNNELDANFIGMPKEGIGVSLNPKSFMGPPKYEKSKFSLDKDRRLEIKMLYL